MKFYIVKTSDYTGEEKPYQTAVLLNPNRDEHENNIWGIEIKSLEELIALQKQTKRIIIEDEDYTYKGITYADKIIEIYDSYRE